MPDSRHIVFACDESGAKGYADQDEAFPGEVGVFAGLLVPQEERESVARPMFAALCDKYRPASGKLHIADLTPEAQQSLRADVFGAIKQCGIPCFWYAIHVAGLHDWHKRTQKLKEDAKALAAANRSGPPRVKRGSARDNPTSMHVELFAGLYAHLLAFLMERECINTHVEIRTDQVDTPIVKQFDEMAKRLLSEDPVLSKVTGWDTVTKEVVHGVIESRVEMPASLALPPIVAKLSINTSPIEDGYVLAADVLANSLNHMFKNRSPTDLYAPLNAPEAIEQHPIGDSLAAFRNWGNGDIVGDALYQHPKAAMRSAG